MSNNKEFGFDILENSGIDTIEDIGTEKMNIDKKDMDRILKNTMKKYEKQKREQGIIPRMTADTNDEADSVSGVEVRERSNIPHMIFVALCSAAAIALTVGSIAVFSRHKITTPDIHEPMVEVTTTVSGTTAVTSTDAAAVIVTETGTETADTASSVSSITTTADVPADNVIPPDEDNTPDWKTAYRKVLTDFMDSEDYGEVSTWDLQDLDNDGTPELLISKDQYHITGVMFYYYEDGKAVPVLGDEGQPMEYGFYGGVLIDPEESLLGVDDVRQGMHYIVTHKYEDHRLTSVQRIVEDSGAAGKANASYTVDDITVSEAEYISAYDEVKSKNWRAAGNQYTFDDLSALE